MTDATARNLLLAEADRMARAGGGIYTPDFIAGFRHAVTFMTVRREE